MAELKENQNYLKGLTIDDILCRMEIGDYGGCVGDYIYVGDYIEQEDIIAYHLNQPIGESYFQSLEDIQEFIVDELDSSGAFEVEIIYYDKAMEYLSKNDRSLEESFEIANDMGYEVHQLSSEILASIHCSTHMRDKFIEDICEADLDDILQLLKIEEDEI